MRLTMNLAVALLATVAGGCADAPRPAVGTPTKDQFARLKAAEQAYRAQEANYPQLRSELAADPVTAAWLTRMFVRDLFMVREGKPLGEDQDLMRAAAHIEDPVEARAIQEITALGAAAVPVLVGDLLMHPQPQPRELGIELLGCIGQAAAPGVLAVAETSDPRIRRASARALGRLGEGDDVTAALARLSHDSDYTVRADAARGLARGGAKAADMLRTILSRESDPFVRRMAAQSLASHPGPMSAEVLRTALREDRDPSVRRTAARSLAAHPGKATAEALVAYLARCTTESDSQGYEAVQESLQKLASTRGGRTLETWRRWASTLPADSDHQLPTDH